MVWFVIESEGKRSLIVKPCSSDVIETTFSPTKVAKLVVMQVGMF